MRDDDGNDGGGESELDKPEFRFVTENEEQQGSEHGPEGPRRHGHVAQAETGGEELEGFVVDLHSEFFKVYTLKSSSTETKNETERGKPYSVMFCDKVSGIPIPPNDTLKLEIPWMPESPWQQGVPYYSSNFCLIENNSPLNVGKYKTEFSSAFEFFYG